MNEVKPDITKKLSYSSSRLIGGCEQKYWHYKINTTPKDSDYEESDAFAVGSAFHGVMEDLDHGEKLKNEKDLKFAVLANVKKYKCEGDMTLVWGMAMKYIELHKASQLKVIKCELKIETDDYLGFIDVILIDKVNKVWWIADLKTAKTWYAPKAATLTRDPQLNLYAHFRKEIVGLLPELKKYDFGGCRYRVTTKPQLKRKAKEEEDAYARRIKTSANTYDVVIPYKVMDPQNAWDTFSDLIDRKVQLEEGEAPIRNYDRCMDYFKPCEYWSQCHGCNHSDANSEIKIHDISSLVSERVRKPEKKKAIAVEDLL